MDKIEPPDSGFATRQGRGQWHLVVLVLLIGVTSIVLAWQAPWWLVPGYWAMLAWLLGGGSLSSPSGPLPVDDCDSIARGVSSCGVGISGDGSTEAPASECAPKARRTRAKRAPRKTATTQARKNKLLAEPPVAATWVQVAPGKFVRVEVASEAVGPCLPVEPAEALPDETEPTVTAGLDDDDVVRGEVEREDDRVEAEPEPRLRPVEPEIVNTELDAGTSDMPADDVCDEDDATPDEPPEPSSRVWEPTHEEEMACRGPCTSGEHGATEAVRLFVPRSCVRPLEAGPCATGMREPRGLPPRGQRPERGGEWIPRSEHGRCRSSRTRVRGRRRSSPFLDRTGRLFTRRTIRAWSWRSRSPPARTKRL